ncbi:dihydrofolate reductase family protein [Actinopolymorpha singaporensis]
MLQELHRQDSRADAFLVGRQTFEDLHGYWPQQADDPTGVADYLNRVQKCVISTTMADPQWQNTTILSGDPVEEVRALKAKPGADIVVTGSITLCHTLIEAGMVDEYRVFVYPVVQGPRPAAVPGRVRAAGAEAAGLEGPPLRDHVLALRTGLMLCGQGAGQDDDAAPASAQAAATSRLICSRVRR